MIEMDRLVFVLVVFFDLISPNIASQPQHHFAFSTTLKSRTELLEGLSLKVSVVSYLFFHI